MLLSSLFSYVHTRFSTLKNSKRTNFIAIKPLIFLTLVRLVRSVRCFYTSYAREARIFISRTSERKNIIAYISVYKNDVLNVLKYETVVFQWVAGTFGRTFMVR